ncbi:MAG: hypothetical protein KGY78_00555 [Anaerolineae bacterium]|nr:hypothetical protein [Anaerolineae bacterium]
MMAKDLRQKVEDVESKATPDYLEDAIRTLLREGEDAGGGINADRLVKFLLDDPQMEDEDVVWAYDQLKPAFRAALEQIPSLFYFEGD